MKIQMIGNKIAPAIDPTETILVKAINTKPKIKQIKPTSQFNTNNAPIPVATPFPPLNLKKIGKVCPTIANTAATWQRIAFDPSGQTSAPNMFPNNNPSKTAPTPLSKSQTKVKIAGTGPAVLKTFVDPAFLLPLSRTSNPANLFVKITEKLTLPIKYEINAIAIYHLIIVFILSFSN